ncbi:hypothetical protein [Mesorhizobium hawassense]|uniref:hypothetical protein n=1 Tax=Mesorhizobium hawassense TaxID=1209954 RepID=UPI0011BFBBEF|nr:hypothetical protein [Mesorhizobium hawassense]
MTTFSLRIMVKNCFLGVMTHNEFPDLTAIIHRVALVGRETGLGSHKHAPRRLKDHIFAPTSITAHGFALALNEYEKAPLDQSNAVLI